MKGEIKTGSSGMGLGTLLFIVFLILKLTHTIAWSWWWVCAPLWIPAVLVVVLVILSVIFND